MRPTLKRAELAQPPVVPSPAVPDISPVLESLLQRLAVRKDDASPRPRYWEFIPERDQNNLITRIIATPYY